MAIAVVTGGNNEDEERSRPQPEPILSDEEAWKQFGVRLTPSDEGALAIRQLRRHASAAQGGLSALNLTYAGFDFPASQAGLLLDVEAAIRHCEELQRRAIAMQAILASMRKDLQE